MSEAPIIWHGPGFNRMLAVSSLRTAIRHTPYLSIHTTNKNHILRLVDIAHELRINIETKLLAVIKVTK